MPTFQEPDDVDFVVESRPPNPEMDHAVSEYIKVYKRWKEALERTRRADAALAGSGLEPLARDEPDLGALLDHWTRVIEALEQREREVENVPTT